MELNSNQSSWTPYERHILHTIWLFCISWWDCVGWMFKEAYLEYTARIIIVHPHDLMAQHLHALQEALYGFLNTRVSGISSTLWCSVGSSGHAELWFVPLQRVGGDYELCYHNYWVQCSIGIIVELYCAQVGQPVQMPGAAHSLPKTSESLRHGLVLWDWGRSHWVWV